MAARFKPLRTLLIPSVALAALTIGCRSDEGANGGDGAPEPAPPAPAVAVAPSLGLEVEAACGQCQFHMPGEGCDLAVRLDGRTYFVQGTGIDQHGDAHADDGFCNAIRRARVTGRVEGDVFVASSFELLP